jgi:hypothetical protein
MDVLPAGKLIEIKDNVYGSANLQKWAGSKAKKILRFCPKPNL